MTTFFENESDNFTFSAADEEGCKWTVETIGDFIHVENAFSLPSQLKRQ
jgi:hypothetical protein